MASLFPHVAEVVGDPTRVLAGTDCGFDSTAGQGRVASDVAWARLRALLPSPVADRELVTFPCAVSLCCSP